MSEYYYLVERIDGLTLSVHRTRHDAVGFIAKCHSLKPEWLWIQPVRPCVWFGLSPRETPEFDPYNQIQA